MENYKDKNLTPEERASFLLKELSIREKIAQTNCYFVTKDDDYTGLKDGFPSGVGQISALEMRNLFKIEDAVKFQTDVQKIVMKNSPHNIPAIFHMEGLSGAYIPGATSFQSGIGRGTSFDPNLEREIGEVIGRQERALGITNTLAPVLDVSRDSRMGRQGESYGEDPSLVSAMGVEMVNGLQKQSSGRKTQSVAKHFVGSQITLGGIHGAENELSERVLQETYAKPFQAAISKANIQGIMPCYASVNGEPTSVSKKMLDNLLRKSMGFNGLTISDYCAISNAHNVQRLGESDTSIGLRAMEAGMDMELHIKQCFNDELCEWFENGRADMKVLDHAVFRILKAKFEMGLFEHPFADDSSELAKNFNQSHDKQVALKSSLESLILLKNDGVLPIKKTVKNIAVVGPHADTARAFFSGYTHYSMMEGNMAAIATMAGLETSNETQVKRIPGSKVEQDNPEFEYAFKKLYPKVPNLIEQLKVEFPNAQINFAKGYDIAGTDDSGFKDAIDIVKKADVVILTLGGKYSTASIATTGEGIDSTDINLPRIQDKFILEASKLSVPLIGLHFDGRPISSDIADEKLNALIEAWNPAEFGAEALCDVLTGQYNPSGHLPVSVARNAGQIPVHYNHLNGSSYHQGDSVGFADYVDLPHRPRYMFGYGLSYSNFEYSNLKLSKTFVDAFGNLIVAVTVTNTSDIDGEDLVQLYARDEFAKMTRPAIELVGFKRVFVAVRKNKVVEFTLHASQLAYLDEDMNWLIESGKIDVMVGKSASDIQLTDSFTISNTQFIDGKNREFYAESREK